MLYLMGLFDQFCHGRELVFVDGYVVDAVAGCDVF